MELIKKIITIVFSVIVFMVLHYSLTLGSNYLAVNSNDFLSWQYWLIFLAYALYFISGVIASILSKEKFVIVGMLAGLVSAISAVVVFGIGGEMTGVMLTLLWGSVFGGIGGLLSGWYKKRVISAL